MQVHGVGHRPEEMSGRVLSVLRGAAERALGGNRSVLSAVIGAPVASTEAARAALVAAGKRAGLHRVELLDEPIAGALAAEAELGERLAGVRTLGVYDLGGRAFSFSLLERAPGPAAASSTGGGGGAAWRVLAARRTPLLGGERFDEAI